MTKMIELADRTLNKYYMLGGEGTERLSKKDMVGGKVVGGGGRGSRGDKW